VQASPKSSAFIRSSRPSAAVTIVAARGAELIRPSSPT
jgi:hypothetical protein